MVDNLPALEQLCEDALVGRSREQQIAAEEELEELATSENLQQLVDILTHSTNFFALQWALVAFTNDMTSAWNTYAVDDVLQLVPTLDRLIAKPPMKEVVTPLIHMLVRIIKLSWLDSLDIRQYPMQVIRTLEEDPEVSLFTSMRVLQALVDEFNYEARGLSSSHNHRSAAASFRDGALKQLMLCGIDVFFGFNDHPYYKEVDYNPEDPMDEIKDDRWLCGVHLIIACLEFDITGKGNMEVQSDMAAIRLHPDWREEVDFAELTDRLFEWVEESLEGSAAAVAMECLVLVAGVHPSFHGAQLGVVLEKLLFGSAMMMDELYSKMDDEDVVLNLVRFNARLKYVHTTASMAERGKTYTRWLEAVSELTLNSFSTTTWQEPSLYYLLRLWSNLVLTNSGTTDLTQYAPNVLKQYIQSRLRFAEVNLLDDLDQQVLQLESIPVLAGCDYADVAEECLDLQEQLYGTFDAAVDKGDAEAVQSCEAQLTWLHYILGSMLGARTVARLAGSTLSSDDHEALDGRMVGGVLHFMAEMEEMHGDEHVGDLLGGSEHHERLTLALVFFMTQLRKSYVTDLHKAGASFYAACTRGGCEDVFDTRSMLLQYVSSLLWLLRDWGQGSVDVVARVLKVLFEVAQSQVNVTLLRDLELVDVLVSHADPENFVFMRERANARMRTLFLRALAHLRPNRLVDLATPSIKDLWAATNPDEQDEQHDDEDEEQVSIVVAGSLRDLRGVMQGVRTAEQMDSVCALFEDEGVFDLLCEVMHQRAGDHDVTLPLLKLLVDLWQPRGQKFARAHKAAFATVAFQYTARLLDIFSGWAKEWMTLDQEEQEEDGDGGRGSGSGSGKDHHHHGHHPHGHSEEERTLVLKQVAVCARVMGLCMAQGNVNVAVFDVFGDEAPADMLRSVLRMLGCVPPDVALSYLKYARWVSLTLEGVTREHAARVWAIGTDHVATLLRLSVAGVRTLDQQVVTGCAMSLHKLFAQGPSRDDEESGRLDMDALIPLVQEALHALLHVYIFEDTQAQWAMAQGILELARGLMDWVAHEWRNEFFDRHGDRIAEHIDTWLDALQAAVDEDAAFDAYHQASKVMRKCVRQYAIEEAALR